jgi:hypothetical protein
MADRAQPGTRDIGQGPIPDRAAGADTLQSSTTGL